MATEPCSMESCPLWTREEEKHKHLLLYSYHLLHGGWILNGKNRTKNTESDHSLNMYLKYLEAVPCFSPFSIPLGCMVGWLQWPMATTYYFFFLTNMAGNILHPLHPRKVLSPGFYCTIHTWSDHGHLPASQDDWEDMGRGLLWRRACAQQCGAGGAPPWNSGDCPQVWH